MKKIIFIFIIIYIISGNLNAAERRRFEKSSLERDPNAATHSHHGSSTDELFDLQFCYPVGVGDGEAGIECDGNYFYTAKWNGNAFYKYELDGTYIGEFTVNGCPGSIRDLAYDGQYFYGAAADNTVYEMDFENQIVISTITAPITVRAIAYDEYADGFWANNWSDTITLFDRNGTTLDSFPCGVFQSYYGLAWEDVLDGGPYLWVYAQDGASLNQLVQFDIATGLETGINFDVSNATPLTGIAGGLFIANQIIFGEWTIVGLCQNDVIWGLELAYAPPSPLVPGSPSDFSVIPDAGGALEVLISWTCPTMTVGGEPLTELDEMRVYRDNELIYTDFEPVIGGPGSCTDNTVPISGLYDYKIVGYNSYGEGVPVNETVWVGEDVPAAVDNLLLEDISIGDTLMAQLTWDNPTTGLHGGAFNEPILGYHIFRHPDNIAFELTGIHTEWIDDTIPIPGYYYYDLTPYNSVGDGGTATSNVYIPPITIINEDFGFFPPAGWEILNGGEENWLGVNSNNAGGTVPEAAFQYYPVFIGMSRLVTYPIYIYEDFDGLYCSFKHFVDDFIGSYSLKVEISPDLNIWETIWEISPQGNYGPIQEAMIVENPYINTSNIIYFAFTFYGNSYNITRWYLDDVLCYGLEIYTGILNGNVTLHGGNSNVEDVEINITLCEETINPDSTGYYEISLYQGDYSLTGELEYYYPFNTIIDLEDSLRVDFDLHYFEPPSNLTYALVLPHVVLNWDEPQTMLSIDEYNIYRDGEYLNSTNELYYMDGNVPLGTHEYYVTAKYDEYESGPSNIIVVEMTETDISLVPLVTELKGNYPNPFNPTTIISYSLKENAKVLLNIYNLKGQKVKTLVHEVLPAGEHSVVWDGKNTNNKAVATGIYFYDLKVGNYEKARKMLLIK
jgi:hypothetical protein